MKNKISWLWAFILLSVVMALTGVLLGNFDIADKEAPVSSVREEPRITVVIDPGHGGEDGGCVGIDGTLEKDLNLDVAIKVYDVLTASGINAALTRGEDVMLYDTYGELEDYTGMKKTYDLKNRVRFAKEADCRLFVSIHMNKFADGEYSGLQVYYSVNDSDSITAALRVQEYVRDYLQPENDREVKRAGSNIYVLHRSQLPAILVECGFLSNEEELSRLKNEEYRKKLALTLCCGIAESLCNFQT